MVTHQETYTYLQCLLRHKSDFPLNNKPKSPFRSQDPVGSIWVVTKPNLERTARQNLEMILTQTQTAEWNQVTTLQRSLGLNGEGKGRKKPVFAIRIAWGYEGKVIKLWSRATHGKAWKSFKFGCILYKKPPIYSVFCMKIF